MNTSLDANHRVVPSPLALLCKDLYEHALTELISDASEAKL